MKPTPQTDGAVIPDTAPVTIDPARTAGAAVPATELEIAQKQAAEHLAGWQRAKADYLNLKKQTERDQAEITKFANAALVVELFPIYRDLKRALEHVPPEQREAEWVKGIGHIAQQFKQLFQQLGIDEIKTTGQRFNHDLHHAVAKEKRPGAEPGTILDELKTGFTMHGRVIEPAQVRVAE